MVKKETNKIIMSKKIRKISILVLNFIFIYGILITAILPEKYSLKEGDIARVNIKSPRDVEDELSTREKKEAAIKSIRPEYTIDSNVKANMQKNIESLFSKILSENSKFHDENLKSNSKLSDEELNKKKEDLATKVKDEININFTLDEIKKLLSLNPQDTDLIKKTIVKTMTRVYDEYQIKSETPLEISDKLNRLSTYEQEDGLEKKKENDLKKPSSTQDKEKKLKIKEEDKKKSTYFIKLELSKNSNIAEYLEISKKIALSQLKPNVFYDEEKTKSYKSEALKRVEPVKVKKDQIIVKEGEPVTKYQVELLRQLGFLEDKNNFQWIIYIGLGILIGSLLVVEAYYLYKYQRKIYETDKFLVLVSVINIITLILGRSLDLITPYLIPLSFAPMMLSLLLNYKLGITMSIFNGVFLSIAVKFNAPIIVLIMLNAVIGSVYLKKMDQRSDILYSAFFIAIINAVITMCLCVIQVNNNVKDLLLTCGATFLASILSGIFTIGFLPLFESGFDIVTTVKLLELSNPNNPLLRKLLIEAPGTYHHCVLVANLAELAAEAIGANTVLARVGAYYHDVGKLKRPYFFKENQMGKQNPHDKIGPNLSALIITSHVKDGVELAKEYKIPRCIQDIIIQHHGTSLVKYFYITAKNNSEKPEDVLEKDFRYIGPNPQSKEAAIIMLADSSEAAVRSINEPTEEKVEQMVSNIIKSRLNDGHLNDSDLTLKDLEKIKKAFLKGLSGIYHERIEYPKLATMEKNRNNNSGNN